MATATGCTFLEAGVQRERPTMRGINFFTPFGGVGCGSHRVQQTSQPCGECCTQLTFPWTATPGLSPLHAILSTVQYSTLLYCTVICSIVIL